MTDKSHDRGCWCCCKSPHAWGIFLLLVGGYFIATELGWITDIPFWGIVFVIFGIYLLMKGDK